MKVAFLLLLGIVLVSAYTETEYQEAFSSWMHTHQKTYSSDEFQTRYTIFKSNMDYVQEWNAKGSDTVLGLTIMADLSNEEYRKIYLGTHFDATDNIAAAAGKKVVSDNWNNTIDWRTKGVVTPIKNQGQCGSCWSFSTTGSVEGIHAMVTNNLVGLSEQNLMDCSTSYGNMGCNGGLMDDAFAYIIANKGVDTEASYPYKGVDGTCHYNPSNDGATITGFMNVTAGSETDLAEFAAKQPVSVAIDAGRPSFQLYTSGIYHDYLCSSTALDHGVLVVGFGVDTSKHLDNEYWIVKNSWGTSWGQEGYIFMSRGRGNNCGIASCASVPLISSVEAGATTKQTTHVATASHHTATTGSHTAGPSSSGPSSSGPSSSGPSSSNTQSSYGSGGVPAFNQGGRGVNAAKFNF